MAFRDGPLQDLKVPLTWTAAISVVLAAVVALGLLLTDKRERADGGAYGSARGEFSEAMQPISGVLAWPLRQLGGAGREIGGYFFAVSENRRLKERIKVLERLRDDNVALRNVNARYEELLQLRTEPPVPMVTARVVSDARGPFSNARLADAGRERGVRVGYPVISDHGAVGRIVGVGDGVSRILLLTDVDSRTPVLIDRTGSRAILTGDGGGAPRLEYLRGPTPVKQGDVVLSSGDGGVFPRGLPIGVAAQDARGAWRVRLYAEAQDVDYVRILAFEDFAKLAAGQAALAARTVPPLPAADAAQLDAATAARTAPPVSTAGAKPAPGAARPTAAPGKAATGKATTTVAAGISAPPAAKPATPRLAATPKLRTGATAATATTASKPGAADKPKAASARRPKPKAPLAPAKDRMAPIPDAPSPGSAER